MKENQKEYKYTIAALYKFTKLHNCKKLKSQLLEFLIQQNIIGTLIIAQEGINGTIAGSNNSIMLFKSFLAKNILNIDSNEIDLKLSYSNKRPFERTKVKIKSEIVTMGVNNLTVSNAANTYVDSKDWNELITDPETLLIDTRNNGYETGIGKFKNAIDLDIDRFTQAPEKLKELLKDRPKNKPVAMYCTGGIRCEKTTSFVKDLGFENVYQLHGGILKYIEDIPATASLWEGHCFVFDNRVAVDSSLQDGGFDQCHGCRHPIEEADKSSYMYQPGVSCPFCYSKFNAKHINRVTERQKQIQLAKNRGEKHLGTKEL